MGTSPAPDSSESISLEPKIEPTEDAAPRHGEKHLEPWLTAVIERRLEDALVELDRLIEKNEHPEDRLSFQLCRAYIIFEQSIAEGDKEYRALASQNAEKPEPWAQLSSSFLRCGFREQALAVAREGIGHFPKATGLLIAEAESLEALQRPADAEMVLEKALDSSGTDHEALSLRLYRLQARNSKNAKAIETLQKGLARSPFSFELLEAKADLLFSSGDFTGSVIAYRQLARLKPNEPSYHALLGNAFLNLEIFGLALDSYRQADTLANSKQGWIIANIGNILNNRGFYGFALEYLERALALDPGNEYAQDRLLSAKRNRVAEQQRLETAVNEGIARATKPKLEEA